MAQDESNRSLKPTKQSFASSARSVWFTELFVLVAIGVVVYKDWDKALRKLILPFNISGFEMFPEARQHYAVQMKLLAYLLYALITILVASLIATRRYHRELRDHFTALMERNTPIPANDFLKLRDSLLASKTLDESEFTGIYILYNKTQDKYYVGQSVHVLSRVNQHLTGHGNGDIYADYKNGDEFTVQTISLVASGYESLNDLERDAIFTYDAFNSGYNRTRGNRR